MILVLGGTEDSREVGLKLQQAGYNITLSVTTIYGAELAKGSGIIQVICGPLDEVSLAQWVREHQVRIVVDATHPFAANITATAIKVCDQLQVNYLRYERPLTNYGDGKLNRQVHLAQDFAQAIQQAAALGGPWLFTTGSNQLSQIVAKNLLDLEHLFVRVLPDPAVVAKCYELGLRARNIIAIQGPFSYHLNQAIYQELKIKTLITKDSGKVGGTEEKISAALDLKLEIVVIQRPSIDKLAKVH